MAGGLDLTVGEDFQPRILNGSFSNRINTAKGAFRSYGGIEAVVVSDLTPTEIRSLGINFRQNGEDLGRIRVSGPLDLAKKNGSLTYEVSGIDRRVLGLLGATAGGLDLGRTTVLASGRVDLSSAGMNIASDGRLQVGNFGVASTNGVTPVIDLDLSYQGAVNLDESTAVVSKLNLSGKQGDRALLKAALDRAMSLAWGKGGSGFRESTFTVELAGLALAEWRPLLGPDVPSGALDAKLQVHAEKEGRVLRFSVGSEGRDLSARVAGSRVENATLKVSAEGTVENFKAVTVDKFSAALQQAGQALGALEGTVNFNPDSRVANAQFNGSASLPSVTALFPVPGLTARAGELKFTGQLAGKPTGTNLTVSVNLARFSGEYGDFAFNEYPAELVLVADFANSELRISRATVTAGQGGALDLSGNYNLDRRKGRLVAKSRNLNQSALRTLSRRRSPAEIPAIAEHRPGSDGRHRCGRGLTDGWGDADEKSRGARKWPPDRTPSETLGIRRRWHAGDARRHPPAYFEFDATARAKNQLTATARLDLGTNKPISSTFLLQSDGLDLTSLYDIFARNPAGSASPAKVATAPRAGPEVEPAPVPLPFQKLEGDIRINRLFVHDVAISNWTAKVVMDQGTVSLNPSALILNGAPITTRAKIDLSVPGYVYDLDLTTDRMPIAPLNDLWDPASAGRLAGTLTMKSHLQGKGITGANLEKIWPAILK